MNYFPWLLRGCCQVCGIWLLYAFDDRQFDDLDDLQAPTLESGLKARVMTFRPLGSVLLETKYLLFVMKH